MKSIRFRLLSITLIVIAVLSMTSVGIYIMHMVIVEKYRAVSDNLIVEYKMMAATSDLINAYNEEFRNPNEQSVNAVKNFKAEISSLTNQLDKTIVNKDSLIAYTGFKNVVADVINQIDTGVKIITGGSVLDASIYYDNANLKYAFVKDDGTQLIFKELQYANTLQTQINTLYQASTAIGGVLILIVTSGSALYMVSFSKKIVDPIQRLEKTAERVAQGDMNAVVDDALLKQGDEIGSLANSFQIMIVNLKNKIQQLGESEKSIQKTNEELERFNKLMVGRELKMAEMKKEIEKLKSQPNA
jgi:nitrogen fixation/metabolism regulation signal transduction histidine kinase